MRRTVDVTSGLTVSWDDDEDGSHNIAWSAYKPDDLPSLMAEANRARERTLDRYSDLCAALRVLNLAYNQEVRDE